MKKKQVKMKKKEDINSCKVYFKENEENTFDKDESEDSCEKYKKLHRTISWFIL